jgi:hypothetical protein
MRDLKEENERIVLRVVHSVYAGTTFRNQTQEWEEAVQAGLFHGNLAEFKRRRRGKSFLDAISAKSSSSCFREHASEGQFGRVQEIHDELSQLEQETRSARASVERYQYDAIRASNSGL